MDFLQKILLALHLLGMAVIVGGWLVSRGGDRFPAVIVWAARIQLLTGVGLVGVIEADKSETLNYAKITVKIILALVVVAMAEIGNARSRKGQPSRSQLDAAGGAGVLAALVAALW